MTACTDLSTATHIITILNTNARWPSKKSTSAKWRCIYPNL